MKKLAIIGASYLQNPIIEKAKKMGIETHVFAWKADDIGEKTADYFYDISIVEKDEILLKCLEIGIDGICSIASDLAIVTVNYVAYHMGLVGNSLECTLMSTNKNKMRECFFANQIPSPKSILVSGIEDLSGMELEYPIIVKPLDRSGSRGITKLIDSNGLENAIENAKKSGFIKQALVEEYVSGQEYSVEGLSWRGKHTVLAITKKYTTGAPSFIETGHFESPSLDKALYDKVLKVVYDALDALGIEYGASHCEIKITEDGLVNVIEIGGRMGGDFIGSSLVELSTGYDYVKAVIDIALGVEPAPFEISKKQFAGVRFIFDSKDIDVYKEVKTCHPELLVDESINYHANGEVTDSSNRFGYFVMASEDSDEIYKYLPE